MTRYDRKQFFERLLDLRDGYRAETPVATELTVEDVIAFAERAWNDAVDADVASAARIMVKANPAAF